jgi:DNA-binding response OmpR family regulator
MLIGIKDNLLLTKGQQLLFSTLLQAGGAPVSAQTLASRLAGDSFAPLQIKTVRNAIWQFRRHLAQISTTVGIHTRYKIGYYLKIAQPAPGDV